MCVVLCEGKREKYRVRIDGREKRLDGKRNGLFPKKLMKGKYPDLQAGSAGTQEARQSLRGEVDHRFGVLKIRVGMFEWRTLVLAHLCSGYTRRTQTRKKVKKFLSPHEVQVLK